MRRLTAASTPTACPMTYARTGAPTWRSATPSRSLILWRDAPTVRLFTRYGLAESKPGACRCQLASVRPNLATEQRTIYVAAVVGSIIFLTSVIFVAGKPLISACFRMMASSLAR
jgi:hypothetical protein